MNPPTLVDGAKLLCYVVRNSQHKSTGKTKHYIAGDLVDHSPILAICQYEGDVTFYLFGCNEHWESITDTNHETIEQAKKQASFEYEGLEASWICIE